MRKIPKSEKLRNRDFVSISEILTDQNVIFELAKQVLKGPKNEAIMIMSDDESQLIGIMRQVEVMEVEGQKLTKKRIENFNQSAIRLLRKSHILLFTGTQNVVIESLIMSNNKERLDKKRERIQTILDFNSSQAEIEGEGTKCTEEYQEKIEALPLISTDSEPIAEEESGSDYINVPEHDVSYFMDLVRLEELIQEVSRGIRALLIKDGQPYLLARPFDRTKDDFDTRLISQAKLNSQEVSDGEKTIVYKGWKKLVALEGLNQSV